jgi:hypothetical protein
MPLYRVTCDDCGTVVQTDQEAVRCPRCHQVLRGVDQPRVDPRDIPGTRSHWRDLAREKGWDE